MDLRKNILTALLLAIGFIMHQVVPGALGSMKFDFMLSFMFVALIINKDFKSTLLTALLGGIITAMTTTFPGGQIANIIDKIVTSLVVYGLIMIYSKAKFNVITIGIISFIGTMVSGTVFLAVALFMVGLPAPFNLLFATIVIPTSITNIFITVVVHNVVIKVVKITRIKFIDIV
ncbi:tryptophan transporter [Clostridium sp. D2Q-11]|uniref:Tryptophan transporter n=1 Tax=Anaeromonas frigoriresistens TaxID=2683708 RepID=A0A942Z969_9FIRM|nr:tryptophan transporter [Anaeromonas frigoriresistens]MBS4538794.1 tryptophan transporter [Anaeromonas frigoriresistens]